MSKKSNINNANLVFEELEPRLLLSADGLGVLTESSVVTLQSLVHGENENIMIVQHQTEQSSTVIHNKVQNDNRSELVIIDSRSPNFQQLHNDVIKAQQQGRDINVVILDAHRDGIEQISEALSKYHKLDAVHIVSHGKDGQLQLGATQLNNHNLKQRIDDINQWQQVFTEGGDLLIYGCNLASTSNGTDLVNSLSTLTGADIAASDDVTGNNILGGDWDLEYQTGDIESANAFSNDIQQNWQGSLNADALAASEQQAAAEEEQQQEEQQAQAEHETELQAESESVLLAEEQEAETVALVAEQQAEQETGIVEEQRQEIVFIDESVTDYQVFIDDIQSNSDASTTFEIVLLENNSDGIERINETLSAYNDVDAVHIISHGDDGTVNLGNTWLNADKLDQYSDAINTWSDSLDENADILIYGCNLAESESGEQFVDELAQLTGADVAASDDRTSSSKIGGDWELEYTTGKVDAEVVVSAALQSEYQYALATYTVTSLADSGAGSLRQAIIDANTNGGADIIQFSVSGTVNLLTALPDISGQITIDGSTATGYAGEPLVILDGSSAGSGNGLTFANGSDNSIVNALIIVDFSGNGIQINSGADGISITGNWIGTTGNGSTGVGNSNNGINVEGANTIIGGTGTNDGNVITNNNNEGINLMSGATGTLIQGNIIGLDPNGDTGPGNTDVGIAVLAGAHNTTIGGTTVEARNIISNNYEGIEINSNNNTVQGNYIGTDITGTLDRGNDSDDGIEIQNNATGNLIGGTEEGAGNLIAFNALDGVNIVNGSGNTVLGNEIHSNGDQSIDLGAGANSSQSAPLLSTSNFTASQIQITGSLNSAANDYYRIEFFANSGGIQTYIGFDNVTTDGAGNATINSTISASVDLGASITATATNSDSGYAIFSDSSAMSAGVAAVSVNTTPTAASNTITTDEDVDYVFSAADFNFNDVDTGDSLQQVQITSLPANGTLKLSGVDVSLNQAISVADIDAGNLTFSPVADENGSGYASFNFKVSDGMSAGASGSVLNSFSAAGLVNSMSSLAFDGSSLWLTSPNTDTIYNYDTAGNLITSFSGPGTYPTGITFDGTNLWVIDRDDDMVYEIDMLGNVQSSFATPGGDSRGLTWDGSSLWLVEGNGSLIYELSTTGSIVSSFAWPDDYMRDITWDGSSLWVADSNDGHIIELDTNGNQLSSFATPSTGATGFTFDGTEFWHADADTDTVYQLASSNSVEYSASAYTMTIDVTSINDAPVNAVPAAQAISEDTSLTFNLASGNLISISDESGETPTVIVTVNSGTLSVSGSGSAVVANDTTASVTISGDVSDINAALNGLQYNPVQDFNGTDTLTITTTDGEIYSLNIDTDLTAYYEFNSTSAAADSSLGGSHNGSLQGDAAVVNYATRGDVLSLDGSGDFLRVNSEVTNSQQLTFSSWVNLSAGASTAEVIDMGYLVSLRVDATNGVQGSYWDGSQVRETISGANLDGTGWHHLAYTIDSVANTQTLYIDGITVASTAHAEDISYSGGTGMTQIGATTQGSPNYFNGNIDDVRIFDRTLSAGEIASLASAPVPFSDTDAISITVNSVNDAPIANADSSHLVFDGDDFIQVADHTSLQMTNNLTMEAWINHSGNGTGSQIILNKEGEYELGITSDTGEIKFAIANGPTWDWHETGFFVTANEWTHVAVTYDAVAGEAKTYINGELVDTYSQSGIVDDVYPTQNDLFIGGRENATTQRFQGSIDDVRIWESTRLQSDIQNNYSDNLSGAEPGLAGNWRLDEAVGTLVADQSSNGNDGTLGGVEGVASTPSYDGYFTNEDTLLVIPALNGVLANDFDADGDTLTVTNLDSTGMIGTLTLNSTDGSFSYDPRGVFDSLSVGEKAYETFSYTANDGTVDSNVVSVTITVTGVNDAPMATNLNAAELYTEDTPLNLTDIVITDVDSANATATLTISDVSAGSLSTATSGSVTSTFVAGVWTASGAVADVNALLAGVIFTPTLNYNSNFTIATSVDDGVATAINGVKNMTGTAVNDVPVANDNAYTINEDGTLTTNDWHLSSADWPYRQQITFDNSAQTENLTDFAVLVKLDATRIDYTHTQNNGEDLRFFDSDGTLLDYEIEKWDEAGNSYVWVMVPQIDALSNTDNIWMYYGNSSAPSGETSENVWDSNYVGVWHLGEEQAGAANAGLYQDSTSNNNDGADNVTATGQDGSIGDGQQFSGAGDSIDITHSDELNLTDAMTLSFWVNPSVDSGNFNRVIEKGLWGYQTSYYFGGGDGTNDLTFYLNNQNVFDTADGVLSNDVWQQCTVTLTSGGVATLYIDGVEIDLTTATGSKTYTGGAFAGNTGDLHLSFSDSNFDFAGGIDEVRISNSARSSDWVAAEYLTMTDSFASFGIEESTVLPDGVRINDTDVDGDALTVNTTTITDVSNGALVLNADGSFTYTPDANYNGSDSFTYEVSDDNGATHQATVTLTVNPVNDAPTGQDKTIVTPEDTPYTFSLSDFGYNDVDGDTIALVKIYPIHVGNFIQLDGVVLPASVVYDISISDITDGKLTFNPPANGAGTADILYFGVNDGTTDSVAKTITANITAVNDAPVANADPGNYTNDLQALNPLGYWRLGDTGGTAVDLGSTSNPGTYNGGTLSQTGGISGDVNSSVHFDGTDYIEIAHSDDYLLDNGTIQLWFNADNVANGDLQHLFSKDSQGNDTGGHVSMYLTATGYLEVRLQSASSDYVINSTAVVSQGEWHHAALSFGSNGMELYLDGQVVDTNAYTGGLGTTSGGIGNYEGMTIGGGTQNSGDLVITPVNQLFTGLIDEVAILDSQLNAQAIQQLYDAGSNQFTLNENETLSLAASSGVLANDTDVEGDVLTVSEINGNAAEVGNSVTLASGALVTLNADGSLFYDPNGQFETLNVGQTATDTFNYTVDDGNGGTDTAIVTITINGVEYDPVITDDGSGYNDSIVDLAPEGYWRLGESSGPTAVDETGNHNGTYTGTTLGVAGAVAVNTAADFDDVAGDHVDVGDFDVAGTGITMMGWFNADDFGATGDPRIISKADSFGDSTSNHSWMLGTWDSGGDIFLRMRLEAGGTTDNLVATSGALNPGQWYFAVATYDSATGEMKLYLDGNEVGSQTHSVGGAVTTDPSRDVVIGGNPSGNKLFDGKIDEVAIFDHALDLTQVQSLYDARNGTFAGTVTEGNVGDAPVTASGVINITDQDSSDNPTFNDQPTTPGLNNYGTFTLTSGNWVYTLNQANVQNLNTGETVQDSIIYTATDGTTQTITVTINGTSDAPTVVNQSVTVAEGATNVVLTTSDLQSTDLDTNDSTLIYTVSDVSNGTLSINGSVWAAGTNETFTQQDIIDGNVLYSHDDSDTSSDSFAYSIEDPAGNQLIGQTFTITVTNTNDAPVLGAIGNQTVDELVNLTFTATATDSDLPADTLTFSLDAASITAGMSIDANTGVFSWTPTEAQGGTTPSVTVTVTDNGTGNLLDSETFTITVNDVNVAPVLGAIGNQSVNELATLSFTATATDSDLPVDTLTFSLDAASITAGMSIDANTGVFSWTPTEAQGGTTPSVTVTVTDNGTGNLVDSETFTITVNDVNVAPVLGAIGNQSVDELATLTFTATATDSDLPIDTLTFSLDAASITAGMSIDANTGVFSWTPTEAQGGTTPSVTVTVTDNGTGNLVDSETFTITVNDVNVAPVLGAIGNQSVDELATLTFTVTATDSDLPADTLTFSLDAASITAGMSIDANTGVFSWTPTEAQGGTTPSVTVTVTDSGTGNLVDSETFTITVNDVNVAPVLGAIGNQSVNELDTLSFTATATDSDLPVDSLTFSLDAASITAGMSIDANTGVFSWTPTEAQGGMTPSVTVTVTDNGTGNLVDSETFTITVGDTNTAPVLGAIGNQAVNELDTLSFTATATDSDLPVDTLTFSLDAASITAGMSIDANTGVFSWTPTEAQGSTTPSVTVTVTDNGTGNLVDSETFTITVNDVNVAPVLGAIGNQTVDELATLTFTATATDSDLPVDTLTFSIDAASITAGMSIDANTGVFSWTPTEAQGGTTLSVTVTVTDSGTGNLVDSETFTITVGDNNTAPVLGAIGNQTVDELATISFTATATDSDLPVDTLTFSLDAASITAGMSIDANTGVFNWTPTEAQGGTTPSVTVTVTDNGTGNLVDSETFTITVNDVNVAPVLGAIGNQSVDELATLSFTATATDSDLPTDTLIFSLDAASITAGMSIDANTGVFSWTPTEAQGGTTPSVTVTVTDNGTGSLVDSETFTITVNDVNVAPVLGAIGNQSVNELDTLSFTATATDSDLPVDTLTFSLDAASITAGMSIDANTGVFSWTPTEAQGGTTPSVTVTVTDNGTGSLVDSETFTITVGGMNTAPVLGAIGNQTVDELVNLTFTATATDSDLPADTLTFSLDAASITAGMSIDANTGVFSWTPTEAQGGTTPSVTVTVTDNGTGNLVDSETFTITVGDINTAPVLGAIGNQAVNELDTLSFTATATDSDLPVDTLTFSLDAASITAGMSIDANTGVFSWTPTEVQGGTTPSVTVTVTDNGTGNLVDSETFTITVGDTNTAPVLGAIGNQTVDELATLTFTATATDSDLPVDTLTFSLDAASITAGMSIDANTGVFSWTPTEAQGGTTPSVTVTVTDNGTGNLVDSETFTITVADLNTAPVLGAIGNQTVDELATLTFTATATDSDLPADTLTFSLDAISITAGMSIDANTGVFSWTPTEAQGGTTPSVTVTVTDNGTGNLVDSETFTITVNDVNVAPVLAGVNDLNSILEDDVANAGTLVSDLISGHVSDSDTAALSGIAVVAVDNTNGSWKYTIDAGANWLSLDSPSSSFARLLAADANTLVRFVPAADYNGMVSNGITFHAWDQTSGNNGDVLNISGFDSGADSFSTVSYSNNDGTTPWTTDWIENDSNGGGASSGCVLVNGGSLQLQVSAGDAGDNIYREIDLSGATTGTLTFDYQNVLSGEDEIRVQVSGNGGSSYTTVTKFSGTLNTGTGTANIDVSSYISSDTRIRFYVFKNDAGNNLFIDNLSVTFDGSALPVPGGASAFSSSSQSSSVTVNPVNDAPTTSPVTLTSIAEDSGVRVITQAELLSSAGDVDGDALTATGLTISAGLGALVDNGDGTWNYTPALSDDTSVSFSYAITDGVAPIAGSASLDIMPANDAPVLGAIGNQTVDELSTLSFTATATDSDLPVDTLTFSLDAASITAGMSIDANTGVFSWTPTEAQGGTTPSVTVTVADNGTGNLIDSETFTITVNDVNTAPVLGAIGNQSINELATLSFTATAIDSDLPADTLTFTLDAASITAGMSIDANTGVFSWTPTEGQGGSTPSVTVTVTDNGTGNLVDSETFNITVNDVNTAPVLAAIGNQSVNELTTLSFTATATDSDLPADTLTFTLDAASITAGMSIDANTGVFSWTPTEAQGGTTPSVTITVTDNGTGNLADSETFTITVADLNTAPVLAAIGNQSINELATLSFTATATDSDLPADTLTFTLDAASIAAGMSIDANTGVFSWTPTEAQGGTTPSVTVTVTDNGTGNLVDNETFVITVNDVNYAPTTSTVTLTAITEDSGVRIITQAELLSNANDVDGDPLTATGLAITSGVGTLVDNGDGTWNYTPLLNDDTSVSFSYTITDGIAPIAASASLDIAPVNDAPTALNDTPTAVDEAGTAIFDLAANDFDIDNTLDLNSIAITSASANGSLIVNGDGTVTYTHDGSETISDSFSYTIADISGAISNAATVTITINPINDAPSAVDDAHAVNEGNAINIDLAVNDVDVDNALDLNSIVIVGAPVNGTLIVNGNGTVDYTHNGSETTGDSFTYTIADISGAISNVATVNIVVNSVNDMPTTVGINNVTVLEDTATNTTINLNDVFDDADNVDSELSYSIEGNTSIGLFTTAAINPVAGELVLDYAANMNGSTQISVRATDLSGEFVETVFTVTVTPVNDAPVVMANTGLTASGISSSLVTNAQLNVNDIDNTNAEILYIITELPGNGKLTINGVLATVGSSFSEEDLINNNVSYQASGTGTNDQFGFTVSDGAGGSVTGNTFNIVVELALADPEEPVEPVEDEVAPEPEQPVKEESVTPIVRVAPNVEQTQNLIGGNSTPQQQQPPQLTLEPEVEQQHAEVTEDIEERVESYLDSEKSDFSNVDFSTARTYADIQVKSIKALWTAIDNMKQDMSENITDDVTKLEFRSVAVSSSSLTLTAGVVAWVLRSGALMTSLLSTIPLWKGYDPLPLLAYKDNDDEEEVKIMEDKVPTSLEELKKIKALKEKMEDQMKVDKLFGHAGIGE